jgi:DNA-binding transcriptional ArsR family regulator
VSATALRRRILDSLAEPDSATGLGRRLGLPRQKINYHLRVLERDGLVEPVDERRRRGFVERRLRAVAPERFSSAYLVALASGVAEDVATLRGRAAEAGQRLATAAVETEVRFASPAEFRAFSEELATELARLAAKYDRPDVARSRAHRVVAAAHQTITREA